MVHRIFFALTVIGVILLVGISVLSVISITGRALSDLGLRPVPGDFELVEAGSALAVFCFLPMCHLLRGHANVNLLFNRFPPSLKTGINALCDSLMLALWVVIAWRTSVAALEYRQNGELTYVLQFPIWWPVGASALICTLGTVGYAYKLLETLGILSPPAAYQALAAAEKH